MYPQAADCVPQVARARLDAVTWVLPVLRVAKRMLGAWKRYSPGARFHPWLVICSSMFLFHAPIWAYAVPLTGALTNTCDGVIPVWASNEHIAAVLIGVCILMALLCIWCWRGRMKRLTRQRNELALCVMLRTREIEKEKRTIEQQKAQIEALLAKAQQSNRLKDEFLANISHEIRTPLHGVLGMTELALGTNLTPEQRDYLELAASSAQSLLALVNDVLDFSKIESGHFELECTTFYTRECIQGAIGAFPVTARQKGLKFITRIDDDVPEQMEGDPIRLRQILVNLIGNAVKFTEKGSISVLVSFIPASLPLLCVRVVDTGIGIPRDKQDDVFEPFRQVDGSSKRKYGGTGLGLAISIRLARDMHGSLSLESEEGAGSTFTLKVPISLSAARQADLQHLVLEEDESAYSASLR